MTNKPPDNPNNDFTRELKNGGKGPPKPGIKPGVEPGVQPAGKADQGAVSAKSSRGGTAATMTRSVLDVPEVNPAISGKPPENSKGIRIVAFGMALVCVGVGNYFVTTQPLMALAYIIALVTGNYMSYINRHAKTFWQSKVVFGGIALVGINCWLELNAGVEAGDFSAFTPGIHFLAGTYVMQSFELRTRTEINTSMMLGLIILALIAPLSKSIIFGTAILLYLCLFTALLYFDCLQRVTQTWTREPVSEAALTPANEKKSFLFRGNSIACLCAVPIISLVLFLLLPRADNIIDNIYGYVASVYGKSAGGAPMMMPDVLPEKAQRWAPPDKSRKRQQKGKSPLSTDGKKESSREENAKAEGDESAAKNGEEEGTGAPGKEGAKKASGGKSGGAKFAKDKAKSGKKAGTAKGGSAKSGEQDKSAENPGDSITYDDELDVSRAASTSNNIVFRVRSNRTCYMKMFGFDHYDESGKWTSTVTDADSVDRPSRGGMDLSKLKALEVPANYPSVQLNQECVIEQDLSRDIPAAWVPSNLDLKTPSISVDEMGSIRLTADAELKKGTKYKVTSTFPIYDLPKMRSAANLDSEKADDVRYRLSRYLQLPKECPDSLINKADEVTTGDGNWFQKTEKLTEYLKHNYNYSYEKKHEASEDPLLDFFAQDPSRNGDCKDFATALVLMARSVGVPARLICGFSPGELNSVSGFRDVKSKNWHSWVEAYIPGNGWVPFDATPNGYLPDKPKEKSYNLDSLQNQKNQELEQLAKPKDETQEKKSAVTWQQIVGIISVVGVVGACLFFLIRAILKALKKAKENAPEHHPAKKFLKKVETDLKRWKIVRMPHETGPEFSSRVKLAAKERARQGQTIDKNFNSTIESFMDKYDDAYYGNKELLEELDSLSKSIHLAVMAGGKGGVTVEPSAAAVGVARNAARESVAEEVDDSVRSSALRKGRSNKPGP